MASLCLMMDGVLGDLLPHLDQGITELLGGLRCNLSEGLKHMSQWCSVRFMSGEHGGGQAVISVPCMSWFQTVITCGRPLSSTRRCPGTLQQGLTGSRISSQFGSQVAAASPVEVCSPLDGCVVPRTYLCNLCRVQIFLYIGSKSQNFN